MNFLDLFAGAGGLSEGFIRAGMEPVAHIEADRHACETLRTRSIYHHLKNADKLDYYWKYLKTYNKSEEEKELAHKEMLKHIPGEWLEPVMNVEISEDSIDAIFERIDNRLDKLERKEIDLIIGGPPCQAYSLVGRSRSKTKMKDDPRNYLYKLYVEFLKRYNPKAFVFENVVGIKTAHGGEIFSNLENIMKQAGYEIEAQKLNARDFGVLQNRERIIIVGWRKYIDFRYPNINTEEPGAYVWELLNDLPHLKAGEIQTDYNYESPPSLYLLNNSIRNEDDVLTHHVARTHNERDLEIYRIAVQRWNSERIRIKYTDLPQRLITHNNRESFLDRFKVVAGDEYTAQTIVAHISKDGHYFIHPDLNQNRSLTVREAARIQSFPDSYYFEGPRTANFVQIGNAVPPLMAEKIAWWFRETLNSLER